MSLRKGKKKTQGASGDEEEQEEVVTKMDYKIVDYLKANTPTKRTRFLHHQVNYFYAHKAVNTLLDSQWATGDEPKFTDRQSVVCYLNWLLANKFFHRAKKIEVTDKDYRSKNLKKKRKEEEKKKEKKKSKTEDEKKSKTDEEKKSKTDDEKKSKTDDEKKSKTDDESDDNKKKETNDSDADENKEKEIEVLKEKEDEIEKEDKVVKKDKDKKKKIKLDMHLEQVFIDGSDAYVWMYEPMPTWYYAAGFMCLLGAVAICLFPLWPPIVRQGVYYLSVGAAMFLGLILGLAVLRFVLFCFIWVLSMGRHHLWILPNLTEDVGFFESFWPLFYYEYRGTDYEPKKKKKKKKKVVLEQKQETPAATDGAETNEDNMTQTEDENMDTVQNSDYHAQNSDDNAQNSDDNAQNSDDNAQNSDVDAEHSDAEHSDADADHSDDQAEVSDVIPEDEEHDDVEEAIVRSSRGGGSDSSSEGSKGSGSFEMVTPADLH